MPTSPILVVGLGFLGRHLATSLTAAGHPVRVLTASPPSVGVGCPVFVGDAAVRERVVEAIEGCDTVVWAAGRLLPVSTVDELSRVDDISPLHEVLTELATRGGSRFVYLSSGGTVYGNAAHVPTSETEPLRPISIYGATKVRCERSVQDLAARHDIASTILRCGNVYGPGQRADRPQGVIAHALACQRAGRPFTLRADPGSVRDYVHVDDVVDVVGACLAARPPDVMNVATGVGTRLGDLLDLIRERTGGPETVRAPDVDEDVRTSVLDISRLRSFLPGFSPMPLPRGLDLVCRQREPLLAE